MPRNFIFIAVYCFISLSLLLGPFQDLNSEEISEEIGQLWRTAYKLTKAFSDAAGPRRIAESVRSKIDKFKQHLPILTTICNPGIKDRHWSQVCCVDVLRVASCFV